MEAHRHTCHTAGMYLLRDDIKQCCLTAVPALLVMFPSTLQWCSLFQPP